MRLGVQMGYWGAQPPAGDVPALITEAEKLGYTSFWTAEAYGSDALTPLAWWGASSTSMQLGTGLIQMSARTPAATAMAALTLDHLSGGRVILGIGASGPQVVEGWYGQPYGKPLARTREYVEICRRIWARDEPVEFAGAHYTLPYPGGTGLGKPLRSTVHPLRADIPIYLGAEGPKNVALAAEICDGWLALFMNPDDESFYRPALQEGFDRPGARRSWDDFDVCAFTPVVFHHDVEEAADWLRPTVALYVGGMGARETNFHFDVFCRKGFEAECHKIQDLYLAGNKADAIAMVPTAMVESWALIGPRDYVGGRLEQWKDSFVTTLLVSGDVSLLRTMAELVLG